jgi:hypothetical protein
MQALEFKFFFYEILRENIFEDLSIMGALMGYYIKRLSNLAVHNS